MWATKAAKGQFDDAPPGATSGPISSGPRVEDTGASLRKNIAYWEKLGYRMKPMGRGQLMDERRVHMSSGVEDELAQSEMSGSTFSVDASWARSPEELEEYKTKWAQLASVPQASSASVDYETMLRPFGQTTAQKFVMKDEDFPPL